MAKLPLDGNKNPIQKAVGFTTLDGTGTPRQSPITVGATQTVVVIPDLCAEILISPVEDIYVDNKTGVSTSQGFKIAAGATVPVAVNAGDSVYMIMASASGDVSIMYQLLGE